MQLGLYTKARKQKVSCKLAVSRVQLGSVQAKSTLVQLTTTLSQVKPMLHRVECRVQLGKLLVLLLLVLLLLLLLVLLLLLLLVLLLLVLLLLLLLVLLLLVLLLQLGKLLVLLFKAMLHHA
jgi:hypothetical protein